VNTPITKSDAQLKLEIESEFDWDPTIDAAQIGVTVDGGVVTLLGCADSYAARWAAERAARRVAGVRAVSQNLTVHVVEEHKRTDPEIAAAVLHALKWNVLVPRTVTAKVEHGSVTLEGDVHWSFQRDAAELSVRYLKGVIAVFDDITVKAQREHEPPHEDPPGATR
jgi:osmotically-inducible protein OsmY